MHCTDGHRVDLTEADEGIRDWANQHASEFVPMFGWRSAQPPSWLGAVNREGDCVMLTAHTPFEHRHSAPACSMEQIAGTLKQTAANLTVKPRYLMAFNEPYDASHAWKNISAAEAVEMWRYRLPAKPCSRRLCTHPLAVVLHAAEHMPLTPAARVRLFVVACHCSHRRTGCTYNRPQSSPGSSSSRQPRGQEAI